MVTEVTTDAEGKAVMAGLLYGTYFAPGNRWYRYKREAVRTNYPKNRRFWVQMQSGEKELSEKQAILGTNAKR